MHQSASIAGLSCASKSFGKIVALDRVDLGVWPRELVAVLVPNGAGKTTAISLMLGLEAPSSGAVHLFGSLPQHVSVRRRIGVMMQEVFLAGELRVREHIELVASYYPNAMTVDEAMALANIVPLAQRPYAQLSGGQKRQVQFAMAICGRPQLLFLDEPTVGLDVSAREMVWAQIRRMVSEGCSIVLTTHYLEEADALARRVIVLAKGRVVATGDVDEIRASVLRKKINCISAASVQVVTGWPEVEAAECVDGRLQIVATDADSVVKRLIAMDPDVCDLEVLRAGLAEALNELTKESAL